MFFLQLNKVEDLQALVGESSPDIIGITESWVYSDMPDSTIEITGYTMFRKDRLCRRGGGVLLYLKSNFIVDEIHSAELGIESIFVKLKTSSSSMSLGIFYRPPNATPETTEAIINQISQNSSSNKCLVIGDLNMPSVNWETFSGSAETASFCTMCQDNFLYQLVEYPTRGINVLDIILTNQSSIVNNICTRPPIGNSDHDVLAFELALERPPTNNLRRNFRTSGILILA